MAKIYTKTGDTGFTSLVGGNRISKSEAILDVYGTCDELNARIGALIAEENVHFLTDIQEKLFTIGGILATPKDQYEKYWKEISWDTFLEQIENEIDNMSALLSPLNNFLLPQGARAIAQAHLCRTICRTLERKIARFCTADDSFFALLKIINRLSDYFFILVRYLHQKLNIEEKYLKIR